jgi:hypothetical protein
MAGFLFANDGSTPVAAQSIADTVDPMYQLHIHNKSKSVSFSGFVPEDFSIGLSADWASGPLYLRWIVPQSACFHR